MGVTQLWQILAPVEEHVPLSSLQGQTLAVDLSIWVCETQCVKQMQGVVSKPFLRNLYFRISHLTQIGVKLVFVIEGSAPELKWDTMMKRQQSRFPGRQGKQGSQKPPGKPTRRNFNSWLKECCELLEILGIPYIQSKGEAEALCALLNANGLVDGCLTNDGDAFLYGAMTVYRNFTMNSKDPHVEMYRMSDIQEKLGIDRGGLIALGLLVGCDFVPKGVPGIGVANAVRLLQSLKGQDVLLRLQSWSSMSERDCADQAEVLARRKAIQVPDFPQVKVIDEFLVAKDRCPSRLPEWKRPVAAKLQDFALIKLEWPVEYTMEKVLPLITLWDMQDLMQSKNPSTHQHLKPHRIVKTRIRQGEPCFEVEWIKPVTDTVLDGSFYVTIESQSMFSKCYPKVTEAFLTETAEPKKKTKAKKKKKKAESESIPPPTLDNLSFQFEKINIGQVTSRLQQSVKDIQPSFSKYEESGLVTKAKQPRHLTLSPKKSPEKTEKVDRRKASSEVVNKNSAVKSVLDFNDPGGKLSEADDSFVPLSRRVQLRIQARLDSDKENVQSEKKSIAKPARSMKMVISKSSYPKDDSMGLLLEDIQNLSLKDPDKVGQSGSPALSRNPKSLNSSTKTSAVSGNLHTASDVQKMSSPFDTKFCSPFTYMKHNGELGDSFVIERSPYYIENPLSASNNKSTGPDIYSPGFFSRPKSDNAIEATDTLSTAEKLVQKLESGIVQTGKKGEMKGTEMPNQDKFDLGSLKAVLNASETKCLTPALEKTVAVGNRTIADLDQTCLSQFGDFQIQNSLLNSLCSSLVQALTPKGVNMTQEEYEKLLRAINEVDSDDGSESRDKTGNFENGLASRDEVVCSIDFDELEKASTGLRKLNQKLLIKPIQIDDEDVMSKLSKGARKKLRRKERKLEMEKLAEAQNLQKTRAEKSNLNGKIAHKTASALDNANVPGRASRIDGELTNSRDTCTSIKKKKSQAKVTDQSRTVTGLDHNKSAQGKNDRNTGMQKTGTDLDQSRTAVMKNDKSVQKMHKDSANCTKVNAGMNSMTPESRTAKAPHQGKAQLKSAQSTTALVDDEKNVQKTCKNSVNSIRMISGENSITTIGTVKDSNNFVSQVETNLILEDGIEPKTKKKRKKKKVKKVSPVIDLSANDTLLEDKKVGICENYLRKAIQNCQKQSAGGKLQKASPLMNISADDTLMELEGLSCKVIGSDLEDDLSLKLKKKKILLKEVLARGRQVDECDGISVEPVFSLSNMVQNLSEEMGSKETIFSSCGKSENVKPYVKGEDPGARVEQCDSKLNREDDIDDQIEEHGDSGFNNENDTEAASHMQVKNIDGTELRPDGDPKWNVEENFDKSNNVYELGATEDANSKTHTNGSGTLVSDERYQSCTDISTESSFITTKVDHVKQSIEKQDTVSGSVIDLTGNEAQANENHESETSGCNACLEQQASTNEPDFDQGIQRNVLNTGKTGAPNIILNMGVKNNQNSGDVSNQAVLNGIKETGFDLMKSSNSNNSILVEVINIDDEDDDGDVCGQDGTCEKTTDSHNFCRQNDMTLSLREPYVRRYSQEMLSVLGSRNADRNFADDIIVFDTNVTNKKAYPVNYNPAFSDVIEDLPTDCNGPEEKSQNAVCMVTRETEERTENCNVFEKEDGAVPENDSMVEGQNGEIKENCCQVERQNSKMEGVGCVAGSMNFEMEVKGCLAEIQDGEMKGNSCVVERQCGKIERNDCVPERQNGEMERNCGVINRQNSVLERNDEMTIEEDWVRNGNKENGCHAEFSNKMNACINGEANGLLNQPCTQTGERNGHKKMCSFSDHVSAAWIKIENGSAKIEDEETTGNGEVDVNVPEMSEDEISGDGSFACHDETDGRQVLSVDSSTIDDSDCFLTLTEEKCPGDKREFSNMPAADFKTTDVPQSPACLADRLKIKLRKSSTRDVLNAFTGTQGN